MFLEFDVAASAADWATVDSSSGSLHSSSASLDLSSASAVSSTSLSKWMYEIDPSCATSFVLIRPSALTSPALEQLWHPLHG